jgi:hypothetical protein
MSSNDLSTTDVQVTFKMPAGTEQEPTTTNDLILQTAVSSNSFLEEELNIIEQQEHEQQQQAEQQRLREKSKTQTSTNVVVRAPVREEPAATAENDTAAVPPHDPEDQHAAQQTQEKETLLSEIQKLKQRIQHMKSNTTTNLETKTTAPAATAAPAPATKEATEAEPTAIPSTSTPSTTTTTFATTTDTDVKTGTAGTPATLAAPTPTTPTPTTPTPTTPTAHNRSEKLHALHLVKQRLKSKRMKRALIQQAKQHSEDNHSNRFRNSITKHMHALHKSGSASSIGSGTGGSSSSSSTTAREVNHGPTPLSHSKDHQDHKGYIDSVIRSLLYDEHRGGDELIRQIIQDVEANINPRDWSLCRTRHPNHYHNNNHNARGSMSDVEMHTTSAAMEYHQGVSARRGEWTLESIKLAYPEASRRVALSIISNAAEGVTFDTFRYDSKAIWITKLLNHWQYHYAMIFIALFHCIMGFVEQSITYDPYASTYHHQSFLFCCVFVGDY